ncbi:MAG: hypothetical protein ABIQ27_00115 [Flavobacterium sp.]|uniref:hypothetical protein n=1 Tax=Flavobacterium sp. TaxID=239 RepID=UPI003264B791
MKNVIVLFAIIFLTSFTIKETTQKLPNGKYLVELDKQYLENGLNNYEFTLENNKFIYKLNDKIENFEINWINEEIFIVKGLTEPLNPNQIEKNIIEKSTIAFRIVKQERNNYYFTLGEKFDKHPIYSGKFVKTK